MIRNAISPRLATRMRWNIATSELRSAECLGMRNADCGMKRADACFHSALRIPHSALVQAGLTRKRGGPNPTDWPFLTRIWVIVPVTPAGMSVKTFIASMTQTVVSGRTAEPTETNGGASGALEA